MLGDLRQYLPAGSRFTRCQLEVADGSLPAILQRLPIPADKEYLLILKDTLVPAEDYATTQLEEGDELTVFPPIKGG